jgi:hypothetical protein
MDAAAIAALVGLAEDEVQEILRHEADFLKDDLP